MCVHWDHIYILRDPIHHHVSHLEDVYAHTLLIIKQNYINYRSKIAELLFWQAQLSIRMQF